MREQPQRAYFLDQEAKVHHGKRAWGEKHELKEINAEEAAEISARLRVRKVVPSSTSDDDPLPRFLTPQSDTIAPEMLARAKDHEERAKAVVDEAARNFQVLFSSNDERFTALEKNLEALRSDLLELGKRIAGGTE
jgi:hypothetical protein